MAKKPPTKKKTGEQDNVPPDGGETDDEILARQMEEDDAAVAAAEAAKGKPARSRKNYNIQAQRCMFILMQQDTNTVDPFQVLVFIPGKHDVEVESDGKIRQDDAGNLIPAGELLEYLRKAGPGSHLSPVWLDLPHDAFPDRETAKRYLRNDFKKPGIYRTAAVSDEMKLAARVVETMDFV